MLMFYRPAVVQKFHIHIQHRIFAVFYHAFSGIGKFADDRCFHASVFISFSNFLHLFFGTDKTIRSCDSEIQICHGASPGYFSGTLSKLNFATAGLSGHFADG